MTISFEIAEKELILCYSPAMGTGDISDRLYSGEDVWIKNTFSVNRKLLRKSEEWEDTLRFVIGDVGASYTLINPDVVCTAHKFYFSNEIKLKQSMFVAYRNISILRKIDVLIERDFYVGGRWETNGGIPFEAYQSLLDSFPKTAELNKYTDYRISTCIKEYFPECDKYEIIFDRFLAKRDKAHVLLSKNTEIELAQFSAALDELKYLLDNSIGYSETTWQLKIQKILQLLYPKYILRRRSGRR